MKRLFSLLLFSLPISQSFNMSNMSSLYSIKAANSNDIDESEMNAYIDSNIPEGWYKLGPVMNVSYNTESGSTITEKCQTITTDTLVDVNQHIVTMSVSPLTIAKFGSKTFTLSYDVVNSTTNISGGYFNIGIGISTEISTPFFDVFSNELSAVYSEETTQKNTYEERAIVSYTVIATKAGDYFLTWHRTFKPYIVMRFRKETVTRIEHPNDAKGHTLSTEVFDHYKWSHYNDDDFAILQNQYFALDCSYTFVYGSSITTPRFDQWF